MSRYVKLVVAGVCLCSMLAAGSALGRTRGLLGGGLGTVNGVGTPIGDVNSSSQLFTLNAFGLFGPTPWLALIGDFSIGLPHTYNGQDVTGGETQKVKVSAFFFDALAGVYQKYSEGGYFYLGAGFAVATADRKDTITDAGGQEVFDSDPGTSLGFAFGAGFGLPVSDNMFGYLSMRQRFVTAEVETNGPGLVTRQDVSLGGLDVAVGVAFGFGLGEK